jgi:hypothetical protein
VLTRHRQHTHSKILLPETPLKLDGEIKIYHNFSSKISFFELFPVFHGTSKRHQTEMLCFLCRGATFKATLG